MIIRLRIASTISSELPQSFRFNLGQRRSEFMRPRSIWTLQRTEMRRMSSKGGKGCELSEEMESILKCRKELKLESCLLTDDILGPGLCPPSVVVVGAGLAGLSAAQRLASAGVKDVLLLEAQDRPGGRIHSCWLDEAIVELGAQWIEGSTPVNPVFNLACKEGLLRNPLLRQDLRRGLYMTSTGEPLPTIVKAAVHHSFNLIDEQAADLYSAPDDGEKGAELNSFFHARIPQEIQFFPKEYRHAAAVALFGMLNALRGKIGDDLNKVSAKQYGSSFNPPGGNVKLPSGMVGMLAQLIQDLPECNIRYCKPVANISSGKEGVSVRCCDGDIFKADYCIVTVPLGVLKKDQGKLFTPQLPKEKVNAIEKLGFGHINTLYMAYPKPFWLWQEGTFRLAWSMEELFDRSDWAKNTGVIEEMPDSCQVLMCNVAGKDAAMKIEDCSECDLATHFTRICRQFLNDPTLPYPSNMIRSKWSSNPYFMGAKSYIAVGSSVNHQCVLAAPVPEETGDAVPRIMFAGEATCPGHHGTLQGARISGLREADRVLRLTRKFGGRPIAKEEGSKQIAEIKK